MMNDLNESVAIVLNALHKLSERYREIEFAELTEGSHEVRVYRIIIIPRHDVCDVDIDLLDAG